MGVPVVDTIGKAVQAGLTVWEKYLSTRQEAYERRQDINMKKALSYAGEAFRRLMELDIDVEDKDFLKAKKSFYKYRGKV